ncbi:hypothetical protein PG985_008980 [Apiospora marii]|uniref:uncharacterized protein n=1 Tax=Apiospora marii TaxID=335849 RepID=UPI00312EF6B9
MAQNKTSSEHLATRMAELALEHSGQNIPDVAHGTVDTANNQAAPAGITSTASAGITPAIRIYGRSAIRSESKRDREKKRHQQRMNRLLRDLVFYNGQKARRVRRDIYGNIHHTHQDLLDARENLRDIHDELLEVREELREIRVELRETREETRGARRFLREMA